MTAKTEIWIGLIGVRPKTSLCACLSAGEAGYLTAVSSANSPCNFRERTSSALDVWGLEATEFKTVERVADRLKRGSVPSSVLSMVEHSEADGRVRCTEIFVYDEE